MGLMSLNGCKQSTDVEALLQNEETRSEILKDLVQNHDYMMEFMEQMQGSDHAMQMMQGNKKMMGTMMKGQGMQMMMGDSTMMHSMMNGMMKDGEMMGEMMQMMHDKGMMSEECMQSGMKMMGDKGMGMNH